MLQYGWLPEAVAVAAPRTWPGWSCSMPANTVRGATVDQ